jgi:hypothetical protein
MSGIAFIVVRRGKKKERELIEEAQVLH